MSLEPPSHLSLFLSLDLTDSDGRFSDANGRAVKGLGHYVGFCGDGANDLAVLKVININIQII